MTPSTPRSPKRSFPFRFSDYIFVYTLLFLVMRAVFPAHLMFLHVEVLVMLLKFVTAKGKCVKRDIC